MVEGYEPVKKTISMLWANVLGIVFLFVIAGLCGLAYIIIWGLEEFSFHGSGMIWFLLLFVVGIVLHELIHGITWCLLTRMGFRHLSFGFLMGGVYCHIDVPMVKRHYVVGALMPLLLLGVVPTVVALCVGSLLWLTLGVLLTASAIGDIMIVWTIRKEPADVLVYDHPSEAGCYVYHKIAES